MPKPRRPKISARQLNPVEFPEIEGLVEAARGSFDERDVEDFVEYCVSAISGLPEHLQMLVETWWQQSGAAVVEAAFRMRHTVGQITLRKGKVKVGPPEGYSTRTGMLWNQEAQIVDRIGDTRYLEDSDRDFLESTGDWSRQEMPAYVPVTTYLYVGARAPWTARRYPQKNPALETAAHLATVAMAGSYFFGRGAKKNPAPPLRRPAPGGRLLDDPHGLRGQERSVGDLEERLEQARRSKRALAGNDMPTDEIDDEIKELKALLKSARGDT
jgi:hypothetical protein